MAQTNDTTGKTTGTNANDTNQTQREQASQQPRDGDGQFVKDSDAMSKQDDANSRGSQGDTATRGQQTQGQGFDKMDPDAQRELAKKGGDAVSQDREHMSQIGKKGGEASGGTTQGSTGDSNR